MVLKKPSTATGCRMLLEVPPFSTTSTFFDKPRGRDGEKTFAPAARLHPLQCYGDCDHSSRPTARKRSTP